MRKGIKSWKNLIRFVKYYFSIGGLLKTLFVPWHRDWYKREPGLWGFFEKLGFDIFTRVIGFIIRITTVFFGIISLIVVLILFPIFLIIPFNISFEKLARIGSLGREWAYPITFYLDKHGRDMRKLPEYLVIDHDHALEQIEMTLSRQTQQNVLIIGSQGIGKTTRLSHLARKMYRDLSAPALNGKRLVELFPEEMSVQDIEYCIKEAIDAKNIILVIENIERFKILPILQPYLDNNNFQMILTTDFSSYHEKFKHNAALMRVAEVVEFFPPNDEITMLYLIDWCEQHSVTHRFPDDTLAAVVILTDKLIMNDYQPEKSIDILEELVNLKKKVINPEDVEFLISRKTGIPLGALNSNEKEKLIKLEDVLKSHIIGQDSAVHSIASALKRARSGVVDSKKPIGSFLFLGTTGVGKTHTAKMLAQYYFGAEHLMIRFDMSEFRELESMTRFIERLGAGIEESPYSLVFFDEIEKAHPDILNLFLQILDEGEMHTTTGRVISFRNTIIICTSNAGSDYMMANDVESQELLIDHIVSAGVLRPEFINRFDATVLYKALNRESIKKITRIELDKLNVHLNKKQNIMIDITDELVEAIARKGHDLKFGVRPLHRVIQDDVETQVADFLLKSDDTPYHVCIPIDIEL
jgi:ATP-dependent Clp protease ATP-binding subunit ClpC